MINQVFQKLFQICLMALPFLGIGQDVLLVKNSGLPNIQNFPPSDYNGHRQNWNIVQDQRGVIWVGNTSGLLSYDGVKWRTHLAPNELLVRSLAIDEGGNIFFGGRGDFGLVSSDSLGQVKLRSFKEYVKEEIPEFKDVWKIICKGGKVYFQTYKFLFVLDKKVFLQPKESQSNSINIRPSEKEFQAFSSIRDTFFLWNKEKGLSLLAGDSVRLLAGGEQLAEIAVSGIVPFFDDKYGLFICSFSRGLFKWNGKSVEEFAVSERLKNALLGNRVIDACVLSNNTIALSTTRNGLLIIDKEGNLLLRVSKEEGILAQDVLYAYPDHQDGLWLALGNGIARLEIPAPISTYTTSSGLGGRVIALTKHLGRLYAGTNAGIFFSTEKDGQAFRKVQNFTGNVFSLLSIGEELLVASPYEGIYLVKEDHSFKKIIDRTVPAKLVQSRYDPNLVFVGSGSVSFGFYLLYRTKQGWKQINTKPIVIDEVREIVEEAPGLVWLGTRSKGFVRVEIPSLKKSGKFDLALNSKSNAIDVLVERYPEKLETPGFRSRLYRIKDSIYFATSAGLKILDRQTKSLLPDYRLGQDLADTTTRVNILVEGPQHSFWVYTDAVKNTIGKAVKQENGGYVLEEERALNRTLGTVFTTLYSDPDDPGIIWLGSAKGLTQYNGHISRNFEAPFDAIIRRVKINGDSVVFGGDWLEKNQLFTPAPIAFGNNPLRFEYAATSFDAPAFNVYRVFLEGFDKGWSSWTDEVQKDYTNLPAGDYTFRVLAKNVYGIESKEAAFSFSITPPWYLSWWAYFLYLLTLSGLIAVIVYTYNRYRVRGLEYRTKELEGMVNKKTKEILVTQEQLIVQEKLASLGQLTAGIAHEIKNPLNFVNNFAEGSLELLNELTEALQEHFGKEGYEREEDIQDLINELRQNAADIRSNGNRADRIVRSMMDHARGNPGERRFIDLNQLVDDNINLAYHGNRALDPSFNVTIEKDFDESLEPVNIFPQDFGRVLLNILNNACQAVTDKGKHVDNGYAPTLKIQTRAMTEQAEIRIRDNGPGIPPEIKEKIFAPFFTTKSIKGGTGLGLSISYEIIVQQHQGSLEVISEPGEYAEFIISLPMGN